MQAVEPYGLMPLFFLGAGIAAVVVLCAFVFPAWKDKMRSDADTARMKAEADIKLEERREERKAEEYRLRDEREQERAAIDSKTAVLLEGLKTSIDALKSAQEVVTAQIDASRTSSRHMGEMVEDTNRKVTELHAKTQDIYGMLNRRGDNQ